MVLQRPAPDSLADLLLPCKLALYRSRGQRQALTCFEVIPTGVGAGTGRACIAGRFLPEPGGLVVSERAGCGAGLLRLPVVCLHIQGSCTVLVPPTAC